MSCVKKFFVNEVKENAEFFSPFYVKNVNHVKSGGSNYLKFELSDKTGVINAKMWAENFLEVDVPAIKNYSENLVIIAGKGTIYKKNLYINVTSIRLAEPEEYNMSDFYPGYSQSQIEETKKQLLMYVESIQKPHIKLLLEKFYKSDTFLKNFFKIQGGKVIHHVGEGGLAVHTLSVTDIVDFFIDKPSSSLTNQYPVDRDIAIAAALLHDIGKIKEYTPFPDNDRTLCGHLQGHINLSHAMVYHQLYIIKEDKSIKFPKEDEALLLHCILASHGLNGPVPPACKEAELISKADDMDSSMDGMETALFQDQEKGSEHFTSFNKWYNCHLYKK